ncbi:PREDICTED: general transcription factor II-I repeat domain-containing protein 2-like, partial [Xyrichtys novacula]
MKQCWMDTSESLFADFKNKDAIIKQISKLQLSDSTLCRHVEDISDNLFFKLIEDLKKASHFSLALDESTDVLDTAQLMIWVRFFNGKCFNEELLALLPLTGQTRGEDVCLTVMNFFRGPGKDTDLGKLVSVTTDGAPSMVGRETGLVALLRKELEVPNFLSYHCIIHQEQLCCKLRSGELKTTMGKVVKVVNFIRSHALKHRQFRTLVEEYEMLYQDLSLHAEVRWLSRGIVLEKFMDLLPVIREFIRQKQQADLYYVSDDKFALEVAFLADITKHLNTLNLKLQGKGKVLPVLVNDVSAFREKLTLHRQQLGASDFTHFPFLSTQVSKRRTSFRPKICVAYFDELATEFGNRFTDLKVIMPVIRMVENPYSTD